MKNVRLEYLTPLLETAPGLVQNVQEARSDAERGMLTREALLHYCGAVPCHPADLALVTHFAAALACLRDLDTAELEARAATADAAARRYLDNSPDAAATISGANAMAHATALLAEFFGVVVTIEQVPRYPLAMGNSEHVVHVRPRREPAA